LGFYVKSIKEDGSDNLDKDIKKNTEGSITNKDNVESAKEIKEKEIKKELDEGHLVSEYLFLIVSALFLPCVFILAALHGIHYFKLENSCEGIVEHYKYITKKIYVLSGILLAGIIYNNIVSLNSDLASNITIAVIFFVMAFYVLYCGIKGLKMLARHETP